MSKLIEKYHQRKEKYLQEMVLSCVKAYRLHKFVDDDGRNLDYSCLTEDKLSSNDPESMDALAKMLQSHVVVSDKDGKSYKSVGDFLVDHICVSMYHCRYDGKRELTFERYEMVRRKGRHLLNESEAHKAYFFKIYLVAAKTLGTTLNLLDKGVFNES